MDTSRILILFMVVIMIYLALVSFFSLLFRITGLTRSRALFQTISLFTGVGFTTIESETITSNPIRRRMAIACMVVGNLFSITIISILVNTVLTFDTEVIKESWVTLLIFLLSFIFIIIFFNLPFINKPIEALFLKIGFSLFKNKKQNIITYIDTYNDNVISHIQILVVPSELNNRSLFESKVKDRYSINFLVLTRKGRNIEINKDTMIQEEDELIVFGKKKNIISLFDMAKINSEENIVIENKNTLSIIENFEQHALVEIEVNSTPKQIKNVPIFESVIKPTYGINIMLIKRKSKIVTIDQSTNINNGDLVIAFGPYKNLRYLFLDEEMDVLNND